MPDFGAAVEWTGRMIDATGVLAIALGLLYATVRLVSARGGQAGDRYRMYRHDIGRAILLGLEFLVAADIIRTVAVAPTLRSVSVLGMIVLIRTFLSMALEVELEGRWPWGHPRAGDQGSVSATPPRREQGA